LQQAGELELRRHRVHAGIVACPGTYGQYVVVRSQDDVPGARRN